MALNIEATIVININKKEEKSFNLKRLVRQRCLLVSHLFFFAMDVLGYMLNDVKYNVEELILSNQKSCINSMFANDTMLHLKEVSNNLKYTIKVLNTYYAPFKTKINWYKITTI